MVEKGILMMVVQKPPNYDAPELACPGEIPASAKLVW
jgi:hypothetical protein